MCQQWACCKGFGVELLSSFGSLWSLAGHRSRGDPMPSVLRDRWRESPNVKSRGRKERTELNSRYMTHTLATTAWPPHRETRNCQVSRWSDWSHSPDLRSGGRRQGSALQRTALSGCTLASCCRWRPARCPPQTWRCPYCQPPVGDGDNVLIKRHNMN